MRESCRVFSVLICVIVVGFAASAQGKKPEKVYGAGIGGTGRVIPQGEDGQVIMHARDCSITGKLLQYEPQPHKLTVGYWANVNDYVHWKCRINQPGTYVVELLQGCGRGQGGSVVEVTIAGATHKMVVRDTGHFQNFVTRHTGVVEITEPDEYQITVKALKKAKVAVMDLRQVRLIPVKPGPYSGDSFSSWSVDDWVYLDVKERPSNSLITLPFSDRHIVNAYFLRSDKKRLPLTIDVVKDVVIQLPEKLYRLDNGMSLIALEVRNGKKAEQVADGSIELTAVSAKVVGEKAKLESDPGNYRIGFWSNPKDYLTWDVNVKFPGEYNVEVVSSSAAGKSSRYVVDVAGQKLKGETPLTGSWYKYTTRTIGKVVIKKSGKYTVTLKPEEFGSGAVMNFKLLLLRPVVE